MNMKKLLCSTGSSIVQHIIVLAAISVILIAVFVLFRSALHDVGAHMVDSIQADVVIPDN